MNPTRPSREDEQLSEVLQSWQPHPELGPGFAREVWRRIDQGRQPAPASNPWKFLAQGLFGMFAQPRFALGYLLVLLVLGSGAGWVQGHASTRAFDRSLQGRYIASIDPFAGSLHHDGSFPR
jgi:hypothetical protein